MADFRKRGRGLRPLTARTSVPVLVMGLVLLWCVRLAASPVQVSASDDTRGESVRLDSAPVSTTERVDSSARRRGEPELGVSSRRFWMRSALHYQELSFTSNAPGASLTIGIDSPLEWTAWAGFGYLDKFGESVAGYRVGGSYWAGGGTVLSLQVELGPNQVVLPQHAYTFEVSRAFFNGLVPSLSYRFADYAAADAHVVMPGFTWYFNRFFWTARYFLAVNQFGDEDDTTHSVMTRVNWNVVEPLMVFAGYARANESFESGNPADPFGGFSANHVLSGLSWALNRRVGIRFAFDYESRNNGFTLRTYDIEMTFRW